MKVRLSLTERTINALDGITRKRSCLDYDKARAEVLRVAFDEVRAEGHAAGVEAAAQWCEDNAWDTEAELYEGLRSLAPPVAPPAVESGLARGEHESGT